ncbi:hypothetical protein ACQKMV_12845 [Lysinibacillus sp. NPDC094403]|uniref:hypothetical protein n=1 Tax=Lysinibacillus sp. NPDC094403 TaxID=3390581 RepID=UPI003D0628B6
MAVVTQTVTCEVCDTKTLVKFQVGTLKEYPIHYSCPTCLTNIYGEIINHNDEWLEYNLNNATNKSGFDGDYILVLSGEFPSIKITKFTEETFLASAFSPFIRYAPHGKIEMYEILQGMLPSFINKEWKIIERIANLYFNKRDEYIEKEINKLRESPNITISPYEKDSSVSKLITTVFRTLSAIKPISEYSAESLSTTLKEISNQSPSEFLEFLNYYTEDDLLHIQKQLFSLFNSFINHYRYLLPVIYFEALNKDIEKIKHIEGLNTVSLEKLDRLYQNTYETLLENSNLIMMFDNLVVRGSVNNFNSSINVGRGQIRTINDFKKLTKGQKLKYLSDSSNKLSVIFQKSLDTKLRNPIGHNNYTYDPNTQLIKFNSIYENQSPYELYLIEFAYKCFESIKINLLIWDLIFLIKELKKN